MPQWFYILVLFIGYVIVMKWILPRLGVPT